MSPEINSRPNVPCCFIGLNLARNQLASPGRVTEKRRKSAVNRRHRNAIPEREVRAKNVGPRQSVLAQLSRTTTIPAMKVSAITLSLLLAVATSAGCKQADTKFQKPSTQGTQGTSAEAPAPAKELPKDVEGRLARVERRLDKVIQTLEQALPPSEPDPASTYSVRVDAIDPSEGPADAKVTIIEGFEFKCPYCAIVNPTIDQIIAKYPKDVRVVAKYILIHGPSAVPPALAACAAAKQGKYTAMKNGLWNSFFKIENGRPMMQEAATSPEAIKTLAASLQLDMTKYDADIASNECKGWIQSSREAMGPLGVNGTPAFFVNGRFLNGAVPFEQLDALVKEELAKADKAIADGTAQKDYYNTLVKNGLTKVKGRFEE
jgi:protein-disulfide isomerase